MGQSFRDLVDWITYRWLEILIGVVCLGLLSTCGYDIYQRTVPETYINDPSKKANLTDYLWEKGLRYEEGNVNLLKVWAKRGSYTHIATLRVKGTIGIEGPIVVTAQIPQEMIEKEGVDDAVDPVKAAQIIDLDYCDIDSSTSVRGTTVKMYYYKAVCRGGEIHFGETVAIIEVEYQNSKPYAGSFTAEEVPQDKRPPFMFSVDPVLLEELPGEE